MGAILDEDGPHFLFGSAWAGGLYFSNTCVVFIKALIEESHMFERITFDAKILGGRPCIRGMRIPVSVTVGQFAHGVTEQEILKDYPDLELEDIRQALEYTA